tara:strand:+ start:2199 stop:2456 length:258 start_codon:yes stop_codon:yes gene_type:complete
MENNKIYNQELVNKSLNTFSKFENQFNKFIENENKINNFKTKLEFKIYLELRNQILFSGEIYLDLKWNIENNWDYLDLKYSRMFR